MTLEEKARIIGETTPHERMYDAINKICPHQNRRQCYQARDDGSWWTAAQCRDCGKKLSSLMRMKNSFVPNDQMEELDDEAEKRNSTLHNIAWDSFRAKESLEGRLRHARAIDSPHWQVMKMRCWQRCRGVCEGCGGATATQLHHLTYDHLGGEFMFELAYLCNECHKRIHNKTP